MSVAAPTVPGSETVFATSAWTAQSTTSTTATVAKVEQKAESEEETQDVLPPVMAFLMMAVGVTVRALQPVTAAQTHVHSVDIASKERTSKTGKD